MSVESIVNGAVDKVRDMWPDGDPDKLRRAAAAYDQLATGFREASLDCATAAAKVIASGEGETLDSFNRYQNTVHVGLQAQGDRATQVAQHLRDYAQAIEDGRNEIKGIIIEIVAILALAGVVSVLSLGALAPAAEATAVLRTGVLIARAAKVGITLNATIARLAASAANGIALGAKVSLIEIPLIKGAKLATGVDDGIGVGDIGESLKWLGAGAGFGGLVHAGRSAWNIRKLNNLGVEKGWGKPALVAKPGRSGVVRPVGADEPLDAVKAEMARLTYQTGREHALVRKNGSLSIKVGQDAHVGTHRGETMVSHTHPYGWPTKGPSKQDYDALHSAHLRNPSVRQESVVQDGIEYTYSVDDVIYKRLYPRG